MLSYVIYTPGPFDVNSGGVICLYYLCHLLDSLGENAYIFGDPRNPLGFKSGTGPLRVNLDSVVVVYPEIVDHNPLRARKTARWLLHKPGFHTGRINFNRHDLIFGYGKETEGSGYSVGDDRILCPKYIMRDVYSDRNPGPREHTCHSVRKGKVRESVHPPGSICIDGKSHAEVSEIFNLCRTFISYDPYSFYSVYAVMCGCESVVVPEKGVTMEQWKPDPAGAHGIAYGFGDLDRARATRHLLLRGLDLQEEANVRMAANFARVCREHFEATPDRPNSASS